MLMSVSNCSQYKAPTRTDVNPLSFLTRTSISLLDMGLPSPRRWAPIIMTDPSFVLKGFREVTNTPSCSPNAADEEHRRDNGSVLRGGLDGYLGVNACDRGREGVHFDLDHTDNICDAPLHQFQPVLPRLGLDCTLDTSDSPIPYSAQDRVRTPAEVLNDGIRYTASMFKNARSFIIHDSTFNDAANDINFGREFPDGRQSLDVDLDESQEAHRRSGIFTNRHSTSESSGTDAHRDEGGLPNHQPAFTALTFIYIVRKGVDLVVLQACSKIVCCRLPIQHSITQAETSISEISQRMSNARSRRSLNPSGPSGTRSRT
ncbi:hypothetical protein HGRIS_000397 [Hohenbuehelia grisea]|uniref:Uncharacterized protein n=1 Tax=Hohenbuehelia grisea TaxID=104357 RepID=A0ABR3JR39_9AGAR